MFGFYVMVYLALLIDILNTLQYYSNSRIYGRNIEMISTSFIM